MKNIEDKIDKLHEKVKIIQQKSNQLHATTDRRLKDLDERLFSQELRLKKVERAKETNKQNKKDGWPISGGERLFWLAFILGFIGVYLFNAIS